jgi:cbb3-type cytochrome oxidase subunit 1
MYFLLFYLSVTLITAACLVFQDKDRGTLAKFSASVFAGLLIGVVWPIFLMLVGIVKSFSFFWPKLK